MKSFYLKTMQKYIWACKKLEELNEDDKNCSEGKKLCKTHVVDQFKDIPFQRVKNVN